MNFVNTFSAVHVSSISDFVHSLFQTGHTKDTGTDHIICEDQCTQIA